MQEEAANAQKQANDLLIQALGPLDKHKETFKKILDTIISLVDKLGGMKGLLIAIGAVMAAKLVAQAGMAAVSFAAQLASMIAMKKAISQQSSSMDPLLAKQAALTASQVAGAEAASFGTVTVAILAGLAAVGGAIAAFSMMNDGVISQLHAGAGGTAGYSLNGSAQTQVNASYNAYLDGVSNALPNPSQLDLNGVNATPYLQNPPQ
jgi:hypothetical protein